ncbi:(2,3-dihydroxybenzoyl)adenylate synthase [Corynebacterium sp. CCM 9203]|uniref:(2,3-dihydroxybenzoyl)adenylate synthase n=1 Tax=Corynebacterium sp. CCM 9203 TaxID=3057615 RepID=UPI0035238942
MSEHTDSTALYPAADVAAWRAAGYWNDDTFATFLREAAARFGDNEAVVGHDLHGIDHRLSYRELSTAADATARRLRALGITRGDFVVVQLPNTTEFLPTIFALFHLGARPVFALPAHRAAELRHFLASTNAAAWIAPGSHNGFDYRDLAREVLPALPNPVQVIIAGPDPAEFASLGGDPVADLPAPAPVAPEELAFLQVSGGSTGIPKLIPRTHADYLYSVRESARICQLSTATRMLVVLPVSHNFTMSSPGVLGVLWAGGTVILTEDPTPTSVFHLIDAEKVTMTAAVPPLAMTWLALRPRIDAHLDTLEVLQVGGAKFPAEAARKVTPVLGCRLQQVFGMAEGLVNYTRADDPEDVVTGTQGRPISPADEILILDDEGHPVPEGESGHLLTRGPYTIRSYFNGADPGAFTDDGFYRTGDIVRRLPTGHLIVEGRDKDHINRGGEKISAEEVENHLIAHPDIIDAALVAIPDDYLGERSCAWIISDTPPTATEIREFLTRRGLAAYKLPDRFEFESSFPLTGVGKISRKALRRRLAATLTTDTSKDD